MKMRQIDFEVNAQKRQEIRRLTEKDYRRFVCTFVLLGIVLPLVISSLIPEMLPQLIGRCVIYDIVLLHFLRQERRSVKLSRLDRDVYAEWMELQFTGNRDPADLQRALDLWASYREQYREKHEELVTMLRDSLKKKANREVTVAMMAGLVFLAGKKEDRDLLLRAKYRHGPAGHLIPDCWIQTLALHEPDFQTEHERKAGEFCAYWDSRYKEIEKQKKRNQYRDAGVSRGVVARGDPA